MLPKDKNQLIFRKSENAPNNYFPSFRQSSRWLQKYQVITQPQRTELHHLKMPWKCMEIEVIILSKVSETLKDKWHVLFICEIQLFKNKDMKVEQSCLRGGYPAEKEHVKASNLIKAHCIQM